MSEQQVYIRIPAAAIIENGRVVRVECYDDAIDIDDKQDADDDAVELAQEHRYEVRAR